MEKFGSLNNLVQKYKNRRTVRRIIALLSCMTVFFTMNSLTLEADTISRIPTCGMAEHVHTETCYDETGAVICGYEAHVHTDACYQERPTEEDFELYGDTVDEDATSGEQTIENQIIDDPIVAEEVISAIDAPVSEIDSTDLEQATATDVESPAQETEFVELSDIDPTSLDESPNDENDKTIVPAEAEPFYFRLAEPVLLSSIADELSIRMDEVVEVAPIVEDAAAESDPVIGVEILDGDWLVYANQDFKLAELAVVTESDILVLNMFDGVAIGDKEDAESIDVAEAPVVADETAIEADGEIESAQEDVPVAEDDKAEYADPSDEGIEDAEADSDASKTEDITPVDAEEVDCENPVEEAGVEPANQEAVIDQADEGDAESVDDRDTGEADDGEKIDDAEDTENSNEAEDSDEAEDTKEAEDGDEAEGSDPSEDAEGTEEIEEDEDAEDDDPAEDAEGAEEPEASEQSDEQADPDDGDAQAEIKREALNITVDLAEVESYPLSVRALLGDAITTEPAAEDAEPSETMAENSTVEDSDADLLPAEGDAAQEVFEAETADNTAEVPAAEFASEPEADSAALAVLLPIDFDEALLSVETTEDDYLISVVASFDETAVAVGPHAITLLNGTIEVDPPYPAQAFTASTDHVVVNVSAPEGAFPEGTTMAVADVGDEDTLSGIADAASEGFVEVQRVHAVDISFRDAAGNEIEPLMPISVVMSVKEIEQDEETVVVHVNDAGEAEVVEAEPVSAEETAEEIAVEEGVAGEAAPDEGTAEPIASAEEAVSTSVGFVSDSFSVYAVVVTKKIETKALASDSETYKIEVTYGPDAGIPDGATLSVSEVTGDGSYREQVEAGLPGNKKITLARFFDIKIMDGEEEVHPLEAVEVRVQLAEDEKEVPVDNEHIVLSEDASILAAHFVDKAQDADRPDAVNALDTTGEAGETLVLTDASETDATVAFMAEGFSVWGVVYTVDFYYGNYEYHLDGGGYMSLRGLVEQLNITDDPAAFVQEIDEVAFDAPELLAVVRADETVTVGAIKATMGLECVYSAALTNQDIAAIDETVVNGGDWALISLKPFDTTQSLTITMLDGEKYVVRVEDEVNLDNIKVSLVVINPDIGHIYVSSGSDITIPTDTVFQNKTKIENDTYQVLKISNGVLTTNNSWKASNKNAFVGFVANAPVFRTDSKVDVLENTLIASPQTGFNFSQDTVITALFKPTGKTMFYIITDGHGKVNGEDVTYCYSDETPTVTPDIGYSFDYWEVGEDHYTNLADIPADSVVKAVFKEGVEYTYTYRTVRNRILYPSVDYTETIQSGGTASGRTTGPASGDTFVAWADSEGNLIATTTDITLSSDFPKNPTEDKTFIAYYLSNADKYLLGYANIPEGISWKTNGDNQSGNDKLFVSKIDVNGYIFFSVEPGYELDSVKFNGNTVTMEERLESGSTQYWLTYTSPYNVKEIINSNAQNGLNKLEVTLKPAGSHIVRYQSENTANGTVSLDQEPVNDGGTGAGATASASGGNYFGFWTDETGMIVSTDANFAPTNVQQDETYTAHFFNAGRLIFYSSDSNEKIHLDGVEDSFYHAAEVDTSNTETVHPCSNSRFKYWTLDGQFYSYKTDLVWGQVSTDRDTSKTPDITFIKAVYADDASSVIAYKAGANGSVSNDVDLISSIKGSTASPADNTYKFVGWYTDPGDESTLFSTESALETKHLTGIHENTTLYAKFKAKTSYTITYRADGAGKVKVKSGGDKQESFDETRYEGEKVTGATAIPETGKIFIGWYDAEDHIVSMDTAFVPEGDQIKTTTYTAKFSDAPYVLIGVNNADWGSVNSDEYGSGDDKVGQLVALTNEMTQAYETQRYGFSQNFFAIANDGYNFDHWEVDGKEIETSTSVGNEIHTGTPYFSDPKGISTFTAVFRPEGSIRIHYRSSDEAKGTVSAATDFISADSPARGVTAAPIGDNALLYWYVVKNNVETVFSYDAALTSSQVNLETVENEMTIFAKFGSKPATLTFNIHTETGDASQGGFTSTGYSSTLTASEFDEGGTRRADGVLMYEITKAKFKPGSAPQYLNNFRNTINGSARDDYRFVFFLDQKGNYYSRLTGALRETYDDNVVNFIAYYAGPDEYRVVYKKEGEGVIKQGETELTLPYVVPQGSSAAVTAEANEDAIFTGWYDMDDQLVSASAAFDPATFNQDMVLTAKFETPQDATVTVSVNNAAWGKVTVTKNDGTTDDTTDGSCAFTTVTGPNAGEQQTIVAQPEEGYIFFYWLLNGKKVSATELRTASINDRSIVFRNGDELKAVFAQITPVLENGTPAESHVDLPKDSLTKWKDSLEKGDVLQNTDKTAQVRPLEKDDYGNRLYQVDITAQSNIMDLAADIDLAFVLDASNSMKFPSKLVQKKDDNGDPIRMVLTQDNLNALYPNAKENDCCYIISDPDVTAKVYRIYMKDGLWRYTDASYSEVDVVS